MAAGIQPIPKPIAETPNIATPAPPPVAAKPEQPSGWSLGDTVGSGLEWLKNKAQTAMPQLQTAGLMSSIVPHLQSAAPQLLHALMPMGGVLRSGGLPAIAGIAGMVRGKNTMAPLFEGPTPQQVGAQAAAASQTPGS